MLSIVCLSKSTVTVKLLDAGLIISTLPCLFILIDNKSEDDTYEKLINLGKKYDNIKVIKNIENGCASGRNLVLEKISSQTKYVLFLEVIHEN